MEEFGSLLKIKAEISGIQSYVFNTQRCILLPHSLSTYLYILLYLIHLFSLSNSC